MLFSESEKLFLIIGSFVVFWLVKRFCQDRKKYDATSNKFVYSILLPTCFALICLTYVLDCFDFLQEMKAVIVFFVFCCSAGVSFIIFSTDTFD